jgi:hypothetical protein
VKIANEPSHLRMAVKQLQQPTLRFLQRVAIVKERSYQGESELTTADDQDRKLGSSHER